MTEIERKFLVISTDFILKSTAQFRITQGYLNSNPERTVRVRIKGDKGFLTIKGKGNESGMSRFEWEKEIAISEAEAEYDEMNGWMRYDPTTPAEEVDEDEDEAEAAPVNEMAEPKRRGRRRAAQEN